MNNKHQVLLDKIIAVISGIRDDGANLQRVLDFLEREIVPQGQSVEEDELPERYEAVVNSIAQSLEMGMNCYLNVDTLEIEEWPKDFDFDDSSMDDDEEQPQCIHWQNVLKFKPLNANESFRIMADFAESLENLPAGREMVSILNRKKPFAHFNQYIHNSVYRDDWFRFRQKVYEDYVRQEIRMKLTNN